MSKPVASHPLKGQPGITQQLGLFDVQGVGAKAGDAVEWRHPEATREVRLTGSVVAYEFVRGQRRTIGLSVSPAGLTVRAPKWAPLAEVDAFLQRKAGWILEKLLLVRQHQQCSPAPVDWREGGAIQYLGETLQLVLDPAHAFEGKGAGVRGQSLCVGLTHDAGSDRLRDTVVAWLMREAERHFALRLDHFAPQLDVRYTRMCLSSAGTRWGSASADGCIRLNWRLMHLNTELIDYVVVHELSHLREMNHSRHFWAVVASVMPDYAERRQALKRVRLPAL